MMKSLYRIAAVAALVVSTPAIANDCNLGAVKQVTLGQGLTLPGPVRTVDLALTIYRGSYSKIAAFSACSEEEFVSYFTSLNPSEVLKLDSVVTLPDVPRAPPPPAPAPSPVPTVAAPVMVVDSTPHSVAVPAAVVADQSALRANERKLAEVNTELTRVRRQLSNRPASTWTKAQTKRVTVLETAKSNLEKSIVDIKKRLDNVEARLGLIEHTVINRDGSSNVYTKAEADAEFLDEQEVKALIAAGGTAEDASWFKGWSWWWGLFVLILLALVFLWRLRGSGSTAHEGSTSLPRTSHVTVPTQLESKLRSSDFKVGESTEVEAKVNGSTEIINFTKVDQSHVTSPDMTGGDTPMPIAGIRSRLTRDLAEKYPAE